MRSGKKEIEIPEGARISSAAADLIKENKIQVKTVAPGRMSTSPAGQIVARDKSTEKVIKTNRQKQITLPVEKNTNPDTPHDTFAEISEAELEDIVNQVLRRFKELKGDGSENTGSKMPAQASAETNSATDSDDLVICRC